MADEREPPLPHQYPFSAIIGSTTDDPTDHPLSLALILTTIAPEIGGVLIRGEKGTAKSTTVRALAGVLPDLEVLADDRFSVDPADAESSPDGPFGPDPVVKSRPVRLVELPVGATEDRVLGSLHLSKALADGVAEYEPGLLARAHRGILYVDEVNLLHDHLVDVLLDAAATGRSTVERDGVSVSHPARFVLVGTMNPEEGELRPQLLDRFGLAVEIAAPRDPALRAEVVRRRMAHDADPDAFAARYAGEEQALTDRISAAQRRLGSVELTDTMLVKIAELCAAFEVDGLRADLVTTRAAVAHAAWQGRTRVGRDDVRAAALLALPHRRRRNPFDAPGMDEELLDRLLEEILGDEDPEPPEPEGDPPEGPDDAPESPADSHSESPATPDPPQADGTSYESSHQDHAPYDVPEGPEQPTDPDGPETEIPVAPPVAAGTPYRPRLFTVAGQGTGESGKRSRALTSTGRRVGAAPAGSGQGSGLHLVETIRAAAPHQALRGRTGGRLRLEASDLRTAVREGRESNLVLLCVDASGSMAAKKRMEQVKSAVLSLLLDAYQRRDKVGLVTFRGGDAELVLPPTGSVEAAARGLDDLPAGGRTPLAEGLARAAEVLRTERIRDPRRRPLLVVVTDGRANHGPDALARAHRVAAGLGAGAGAAGVAALVVDCENGRFRMGLATTLAEHLQAEYTCVGELSAEDLTDAVRDRVPSQGVA